MSIVDIFLVGEIAIVVGMVAYGIGWRRGFDVADRSWGAFVQNKFGAASSRHPK